MSNYYEVEVFIDVEPSRVWSALRKTEEINRWFGWQAATLPEEIQFIFFDAAAVDEEGMRLTFESLGGQYVEVVASRGSSAIRVVQPGEGDEHSDAMREGWIAFFNQLKRYIEDHPGKDRRTIYLSGEGEGAAISEGLSERLPGEVWYSGGHTRVIGTPDFGPGLAALTAYGGYEPGETGKVSLTLTTWGLSSDENAALSEEWFSWWSGLATDPEFVTGT